MPSRSPSPSLYRDDAYYALGPTPDRRVPDVCVHKYDSSVRRRTSSAVDCSYWF